MIRSFFKISIILVFVFISNSLFAQVLNNNGAAISVTNGAVVQGDTLENTAGTITNNGTIGLNGHYINADSTKGNGNYIIKGNWLNTGKFVPGISTVRFNGSNYQTITSGGDSIYHLEINNTGSGLVNRIRLLDNANVRGTLTLDSGIVETGTDTLYLINPLTSSLNYVSTTNSRIIGKFERSVNASNNYLFPVGSEENYNPLNLTPNALSAGSLLSEFIATDPDSIGLPLAEEGYVVPTDTVEIYDADSVGYWSLTAYNGFASNDFDINLNGTGFRTPYQNATRIIKRPFGGNWTLDGDHIDGIGSVAFRNTLIGGMNGNAYHFGWGWIRPRIQTQPADTAICDGESATFSVVATGRGELNYRWEVHERSGGWQQIADNSTYANSDTDTLLIISADTTMNGYKYRVIITDSLGNFKRSNSQATLTVYPRPQVTATPQQDTICNLDETYIVLTSTEPLTSYNIEILNQTSNSILNDNGFLDGDTIKDILNNPTLEADSVVYRITPYGPFTPSCSGDAIIVVVWVEPTVEITALNDTICNSDFTNIDIRSENITTNGIRYTWTSSATDVDVSGYTNNATGQDTIINIADQLVNVGIDSAIVHYVITPWTLDASSNLTCEGTPIYIDIYVEPTVQITAANDTICDGTNTNIVVNSPNTTTNGIRYTWTYIDNPNINNETNSIGDGQIIGTPIVQNLVNISNSAQLVQYLITPWTVNASDNNECTDANEIITIDIWIEPTPQVYISVGQDTICNDTYTEITLTTPSVLTTGVVTFDYNSVADLGLSNNSTGITGLLDGAVIADSLHNNTAFPAYPLVVRYNVTPKGTAIACADGPIRTDSVTVHPTADTYMFADSVRCYLESNGEASVIAENGINNFTYRWNDFFNQGDSLATGLPIGMYTVTVTDNQACTKVDSVLIEQPYRIVPIIDTIRNVSCFGSGDAYIILTPTGGNGTYSYSWSNSESTDSIGGLDGGVFRATVTDWKGCAQDTVAEVDEPPQISIQVTPHHITCNGEDDGWAEVDVVGLDQYEWSNGATTAIINNLSPGPYSVTASNAEGCKSIEGVIIQEPDVLKIDSILSTRISCAGDADGLLDLYVSGGNHVSYYPPYNNLSYTYSWTTTDGTGLVSNAEDQTGLSGGTYYVTVSDWQGCFAIDSANVHEPPAFISDIVSTDVLCNGDDNGTIDLTVQGGNTESPYTYLWETSGGNGLVSDSEDQTGLTEGNYFVTITDAKFCEIYDTAIIIEPDLLEAIFTSTNVSCYGYDDGSAIVEIMGGTGIYTISWSNGESNDTITGLSADTYTVDISDEYNCVLSDEIEITSPEQIQTNISSQNITCFGYNDGEIIVTPDGGTIPYDYIWSHSTIFEDSLASNLGPGNYSISVVDNNNCIEISSVDLTQPDPLLLSYTKEDITCFGMDDGWISLDLTGGTPEYTYTWSDGNNSASANMLTFGTYDINISDQLNCYVDTSIEIIEPDKLEIFPVLQRPTCTDIRDGQIELNITGGRTPYIIYWDNGANTEDLYEIRSGIYKVLITDSSLCEIDTTFIVRSAHDFCINIPSAFSPNEDNINDKWEIDMSLYPQAEVEIYDRFGKRIFYTRGYEASKYWDGTYNGKKLPMDAYYYIIYLKNGSGRISGTVTLLR